MSTADANSLWQVHLFGDGVSTQQQGVLVLTSYPILLVLVILSAFIRYMWVALAAYCALMFVLSCTTRPYVERRHAAVAAAAGQCSHNGLSAAAISMVAPAFLYDAADCGEGEAAECAVCLEAVRGGEKARRLPACAHTFHVGCIDMWLDSHATCPVCRCHVLPQKKAAGKELPDPSCAQAPTEAQLPPV
jgi:hypothetical protein